MPFPASISTVMTTAGFRERKSMQCWKCLERVEGLFTRDPNGQPVCHICAGEIAVGVLTPGDENDASGGLPEEL